MQKNFWCIVTYVGASPLYYCGYFKKGNPAISADFYDALKLHDEAEAQRILKNIPVSAWVIEEHAYV